MCGQLNLTLIPIEVGSLSNDGNGTGDVSDDGTGDVSDLTAERAPRVVERRQQAAGRGFLL